MFIIEINKSFINENFINEIFNEVILKINDLNRPKAIVFGNNNNSVSTNDYNIISFEEAAGAEKIFITELSLKLLSSLANLTYTSKEEEFILNSILKGKEIYIFQNNIEYKKYIDTLPKEIYKKYVSYENTLKSYNVKFIKNINELQKNNSKKEKLISLDNINKYISNGKVVLNNDMIITPLAKDYIAENKLILERR